MTKANHQLVYYLCQPESSDAISKAAGKRETLDEKIANVVKAGDAEVAKVSLAQYLAYLWEHKPSKGSDLRAAWKEQKRLAKAALQILEGDVAKSAAVSVAPAKPPASQVMVEDYNNAVKDYLKSPMRDPELATGKIPGAAASDIRQMGTPGAFPGDKA